jgi:hypothetical protein
MSEATFYPVIQGSQQVKLGDEDNPWAVITVRYKINATVVIKLTGYSSVNRGSISCSMAEGYPIVSVSDPASQSGDGFWNAGGMFWYGELAANARHDRGLLLPAYASQAGVAADQDSEANAIADVRAMLTGTDPSFPDAKAIAYSAVCDKRDGQGNYQKVSRTSGTGFSSSWGRTLVDADFDESGNLKPIDIAGIFIRFYYRNEDVDLDGPPYDRQHYFARTYAKTISTDAGGNPHIWLTTKELAGNLKYYPWERKVLEMSNERWLSCNRNYDDFIDHPEERRAFLRRKEGNAWAEVLNDYFSNAAADNSSWIKSSQWKKALPVGIGNEGYY